MNHLVVTVVVGILVLLGPTGGAWTGEVTYDRLLNTAKDPNNWLMYYGSYNGWRHSALDQINTTNVNRLVVKWAFQTGPDGGLQATPLVVDGIMYLANGQNHVFALGAATGSLRWHYAYKLPDAGKMPTRIFGRMSRGVSIGNGMILMGTLDAHLVALDTKTGTVRWDRKVGDYSEGQTFTAPPLIVKDKAIIGMVTIEFPTRGFIEAYNLRTGEPVWRFYTIPGPGEPGHETWGGDSWQYGCASAWMPGTYDPDLNLAYFGIGNPCPLGNGDTRPGDNLYSSSIVALDPETGKLKWYFQTTPHDLQDFDATSELILVDTVIHGSSVKALLQANKNGYFYVLDRTNGRFLYAKPFVSRINWTTGLDEKGRPRLGAVPTASGALICPHGWVGAKSWNHSAYHPQTGYVYIPAIDMCLEAKTVPVKPRSGALFLGAEIVKASEDPHGELVAIDAKTGERRWQYGSKYPMAASVLATAGGFVLTGDLEGNVLALDATGGELLWAFKTGSGQRGSPITYAVNGKQYIAVPSGWGPPWGDGLPNFFPALAATPFGSTLFVFGLFDE